MWLKPAAESPVNGAGSFFAFGVPTVNGWATEKEDNGLPVAEFWKRVEAGEAPQAK